MKSTITVKGFDFDFDWAKFNQDEDLELQASDYLSYAIASFYTIKDRTYKANLGVTLDTLSLHSDGDEIGFRFYHKTPKAKNKRHAFFAEFVKTINELNDGIEQFGFEKYFDNMAEDAVREIVKQEN